MSQTAGFRLARLMMLVTIFGCMSVSLIAGEEEKAKVQFSTADAAKAEIEKGLFDVQNVYQAGAIRHFNNAIEADPSYGLAKVFAASVNDNLSDEEKQALSDEGMSQMAGASTEEVMFALAVRATESGDQEKAHAIYQALSKLVPGDATVAYFTVIFSGPFQSLQQQTAVAKFVEQFPDHAAAQNQFAYDSWTRGDREAALEAATRYVELAPDHPNPHDSYAEMMLYMGMFDKSVEHYKKAIAVDDNFWQGYQGLANALAFNGEMDAAREALSTGAEKAPNSNIAANFHRAKAVTYLIVDDTKGARKALQQVIDMTEGDDSAGQARTLAHYQLAGMSAMDGKGKDAKEFLAGAEASRPGGWTNYQRFMTAMVSVWSGDVDGARAIVAEMEDEDYLLTGAIALADGDHAKAAESFQKTGLNSAMERIYMAKCEAARGNNNAADALVRDIHNLDEMDIFNPMDPLAHAMEDNL